MTREEAVGILKFARSHAAYESDIAVLEMAISALQEQKTPCSACGYGGKHLDAPPCTTCPAHPKLESTSKLLESNGDSLRTLADEQMMAEYIEREALSKWLHETMKVQTTTVGMACVRDFWNKVLDTPAADVAPVVHGRWVPADGEGETCDEWDCSICERRLTFGEEMEIDEVCELNRYCPNCGARMDGE